MTRRSTRRSPVAVGQGLLGLALGLPLTTAPMLAQDTPAVEVEQVEIDSVQVDYLEAEADDPHGIEDYAEDAGAPPINIARICRIAGDDDKATGAITADCASGGADRCVSVRRAHGMRTSACPALCLKGNTSEGVDPPGYAFEARLGDVFVKC